MERRNIHVEKRAGSVLGGDARRAFSCVAFNGNVGYQLYLELNLADKAQRINWTVEVSQIANAHNLDIASVNPMGTILQGWGADFRPQTAGMNGEAWNAFKLHCFNGTSALELFDLFSRSSWSFYKAVGFFNYYLEYGRERTDKERYDLMIKMLKEIDDPALLKTAIAQFTEEIEIWSNLPYAEQYKLIARANNLQAFNGWGSAVDEMNERIGSMNGAGQN